MDPLWYKDAVIYEVHVRAFCDGSGNGAGDFRGLTSKLDYLQDLGVTAIWLLPFYPSPRRDDGYDIADYTSIHPEYGTLEAFQEFLNAAHDRGLKVITELVINHTSDQHPWFQLARLAPPGSSERDFYVWSDSPEKYPEVRIIFKDFETSNWSWDKVAKQYYWHRFYSHQPDLNFDNPAVWEALFPVADFWFNLGVDGMRLDAIPYLFEREGTTCENLPETHDYLRALRKHIDEKFPGRMLLAEANMWPEDSVAYFGQGDECHMAFHFPVMPRLFMGIHMEDRLPIVDILEQTPAIPNNCQWAIFLRNHDELTLEMVTDEERDYMYKAYADDPRARINLGIRHRLAPLLDNNRRRMELMNGLLFSLPGTPVLYYGDEIGMGDNIWLGDRNGVRTPMQWSADRNAGFSRANPQKLYLPVIIDPEYHYEAVNVEAQSKNPTSLLWWTKRLIAMRRRRKALSRGSLEFLRPLNRRVLAFVRHHEDETILVVANLSRFVQHAELDLSAYQGVRPIEVFGGTPFPAIGTAPYVVMLGPHSFYWFSLSKQEAPVAPQTPAADALPMIPLPHRWESLRPEPGLRALEEALGPYLTQTLAAPRREPPVRSVRIDDCIALPTSAGVVQLLLMQIEQASTNQTWLPVALVNSAAAHELTAIDPQALIVRVPGDEPRWLANVSMQPAFVQATLTALHGQQRIRSAAGGELLTQASRQSWKLPAETDAIRHTAGADGRCVTLGESLVLTPRSHVEAVPRPEIELDHWLTEQHNFPHAPRWLGSLAYRRRAGETTLLADLRAYVPNEGTAWQFTLEELSAYFDRVLMLPEEQRTPPALPAAVVDDASSATAHELLGGYLDTARLLAQRLAALHLTVAANSRDPDFAPEAYYGAYQRSIYQGMRNLTHKALLELRQSEPAMPELWQAAVKKLLSNQLSVLTRFHRLVEGPLAVQRLRMHGNFHLASVLRSGKDFVIVGFDGAGSAHDRRIKRTPMRDVAGMLHSFQFAAAIALHGLASRRGRAVGVVRPEDHDLAAAWARYWSTVVQRTFLDAYLQAVAHEPLVALTPADADRLLDALLLERSLAELRNQLPDNLLAAGAVVENILHHLATPPLQTVW